ncbi:PspA-associated protein PspAB [Kitasatospora aureofaciens]|uniref:PspA-associated protein PspAB n=1 Tax=Kitasatospora aureofaciens TaxID=1894 RepID=UPI0036F4A283
MGFLDALFGRTKPVKPDLDQLFGLPSAALTLEAGAGFLPTGLGSVCFAAVEGAAFVQVEQQVRALLDADTERGGVPVEASKDGYGYSWLLARHAPDELPELVNDLHAVNSELEANGFGPQLLCSLVAFRNGEGQSLALVYLYKRGTFYPMCKQRGQEKRNNALEIEISNMLKNDLRIESDLSRWFPLWGAPGMEE